jgi:DivIVA domain-containing protein
VIRIIVIVLAGAVVAMGITGATFSAVILVRGRTDGRPLAPDERRKSWQYVLSSALLAALALSEIMTLLSPSEFWPRAEIGAAIVLILYTVATWYGAARAEGLLGEAAAASTDRGVPPEWPRGPELPQPAAGASGRQIAEWVHRKQFSTTRLRSGYDEEEVDILLDKVRDALLGTGPVPVTLQEVTSARFTRTHLRPGYVEEEVDAFLADVGLRLA